MFVVTLLFLASGLSLEASPVDRVVGLIRDLKSKIESDGKVEQKVYDKFACWCEETTARKASNIESNKASIEALSKSIVQLNGRLGSSGAEIKQLAKNIAETKETISKATEMRSKENADYLKTKAAMEQAIANLEKAITVLGGLPQQQRKGFIDAKEGSPMGAAMMETDVLTVAAGVRSALHLYAKSNDVSGDDFTAVKSFLTSPGSLLSVKSESPHKGTYNTQSTMIQGILSEMYDNFGRELQSTIDEEAERKSNYDELMITKRRDQALLEQTLVKKNTENGDDTKQLADDSQEREQTQVQLKEDEAFFETTKDSCKAKADEWAERSRLRTEELSGIGQAIDILTSDEAQAIFQNATTTFVQFSAETKDEPKRTAAYDLLKQAATKSGSFSLAVLASKVQTTWHFDAVIADIDKMISALRDEEQADLKHRDWCQTERHNSDSKNEALEYEKDELDKKVVRLQTKKGEYEASVLKTEGEMADLQSSMDTALDNRNEENSAYKQAMKDDAAAVMLLGKAIEALSKFYVNNDMALVQKKHHKHHKGEPEYKANQDTAPETFGGEGGSYGGRKSENTGVVAIIGLIKEDLEKEMVTSKEDEAKALAAYQALYDESAASMKAMEDKKTSLNQDIADTAKEIADANAVLYDTQASKDATDAYLGELGPNCDWIDRTFDSRAEKRKAEISGLQNAKSVLAGGGDVVPAGLITKGSAAKKHNVEDELNALDATEKSFESSFLQRRA